MTDPDAALNNFPQDPSDFDSDPRISFSKLDDKYILETDDGNEFEWNSVLKRWIQTVRPRFTTQCRFEGGKANRNVV